MPRKGAPSSVFRPGDPLDEEAFAFAVKHGFAAPTELRPRHENAAAALLPPEDEAADDVAPAADVDDPRFE